MRIAIAFLVLAASLSACGGGKDEPKSARPPTPPTSTTSTPLSTPMETDEPELRLLSKNDLKAALIGLNDVPPGYTQDPTEEARKDKMFCDYKPPTMPKIGVTRGFTNDADQGYVTTSLRQYASAEAAKANFDKLVDVMKTCKTDTDGGDVLHYTVMSAPQLADGAIGIQIKVSGYTLLQNFVLDGPTLVSGGGVGLSAQEVANLLKRQVDLYEAAAK
jgi:hypothetical protein